jgi:uncharacterized protein YxeA
MKKKILVIFIILIVVGVGFLVWKFKVVPGGGLFGKQELTVQKENKSVFKSEGPYELARKEAVKWQVDAEVAFMEGGKELSDEWRFIFASKQVKGKGFEVRVSGQDVLTKEIDYSGSGEVLPEDIISQDEAVRRVKEMPAYKDAEIIGVEAVYGKGDKVWYWGVRTNKGTVSVEAGK